MCSRAHIISYKLEGLIVGLPKNEMKFLGPDAYDRSMILPVPR